MNEVLIPANKPVLIRLVAGTLVLMTYGVPTTQRGFANGG